MPGTAAAIINTAATTITRNGTITGDGMAITAAARAGTDDSTATGDDTAITGGGRDMTADMINTTSGVMFVMAIAAVITRPRSDKISRTCAQRARKYNKIGGSCARTIRS